MYGNDGDESGDDDIEKLLLDNLSSSDEDGDAPQHPVRKKRQVQG